MPFPREQTALDEETGTAAIYDILRIYLTDFRHVCV